MALWRGFDRAALDAELNLRQRTPEHVEFFARWADESAAVRAELSCELDVAYGASPGETLDLFLPENGAPAPLLIFIHGGYWQSLDKGDFSFLAPAYLAKGIAFASLNYTLAPEASIGRMVEEVCRAIAWLHDNAARLGLDSRRFAICGHSAGGHLAAMAHSVDWSAGNRGSVSPFVFCCSISGIYQLEPLRHSYQQEILSIAESSVPGLSPQWVVPSWSVGPLILAVGSEEPGEFITQQDEYFAAWTAAGHSAETIPLPGRHHFNAVEALSEADHPLYSAVCHAFGESAR